MKKILALSAGLLLLAGLQAGAIRDKYTELENQDKNPTLTDDVKKKTLEQNLTVGVKLSLLRYYKYCDYGNVKIEDGQYERAEIHKFMYYVQYKEFTGYLIYDNDPEVYQIFPIDERFYINQGASIVRLGDSGCSDATTSRTPKTDK